MAARNQKVENVKIYIIKEFILEEKEEHLLELVKKYYEEGNLNQFIRYVKKAISWIKRRESRITRRLFRAATKAKIETLKVGRNKITFEVFKNDLLEKHNRLYHSLAGMLVEENKPLSSDELAPLIDYSLKLENEIITDLRVLITELNKLQEES